MSPQNQTIYRGHLVLLGDRFQRDMAVVERGGEIVDIITGDEADVRVADGARGVELGDVALVPGQINVHSHAFQRGLRGRTEHRLAAHGDDDFWSWRSEMYQLANRVTAEEMEVIAGMAFLEMLRAGITHVGEFHYVHHRPDGTPYDEPGELAHRIARAARRAGIRLTMLPVAYHTGDIGEAAAHEQRRFIHDDVETYLQRVSQLARHFADAELVDVGMAPHSIRAVPRDWMEAIAEAGRAQEMAIHIHVCEQRKEIAASRKAYGVPPVEALHEWGVLDASWTLIHGTHLSDRELEILGEIRPTVGACPTTERNLGDGFLPARELVARDVPIAVGSDSHTVIDPFAEMRCVEYHERLRAEERNVLVAAAGGRRTSTADVLWPMGTDYGARALQSDGGAIRPGAATDLVALDLSHPSLAGATASTLLSDVVLSMSADAVRNVVVAGELIVDDGRHRQEDEMVGAYRELMARYHDSEEG